MIRDSISVGNRIEISMKKDYDEIKTKYISLVEEIYDNDQLLIYRPISYGSLVQFSLGKVYSLLFISDKKMYKYDAEFIKYIDKEDYNFILIKLSSEGEKIQRREFFRFDCVFPFRFEKLSNDLINAETFTADEDNIELKGIIKDIGGGGIRFISDELLEQNDKIKCLIDLNSDFIITFGKVLERQLCDKSNYTYQYRVEFFWLSKTEKEQIIKYIFEEQRKIVRRIRDMLKK